MDIFKTKKKSYFKSLEMVMSNIVNGKNVSSLAPSPYLSPISLFVYNKHELYNIAEHFQFNNVVQETTNYLPTNKPFVNNRHNGKRILTFNPQTNLFLLLYDVSSFKNIICGSFAVYIIIIYKKQQTKEIKNYSSNK